MLLGHWIEMRSVRKASGALNELASLLPDTAIRIDESGNEQEVLLTELSTGNTLLIKPGASIPTDAKILSGSSTINESMITGESKPVHKQEGDMVIAGTINKQGSLRVQVTATGEETTLSGIMKLVDEAQKSKSETQLLADKASGWLFYIALAAGTITAIVWTFISGLTITTLERVVTVLIISCPHALGLAVPLVVSINTHIAAKNGILIHDRKAMEQARNLDVIVFDKTGTLTKGEMEVQDMLAEKPDKALAILASIEQDSEHIIAEAILNKAKKNELTIPKKTNFESIQGKGVRATIHKKQYFVGGPNLAKHNDFIIPKQYQEFAQKAQKRAQTVVYLFTDKQAIAAISLADTIREESYQAINQLHKLGVSVAMLTGDSKEVAQAVAKELNIDTYFAEVLPEDKDKKIHELQKNNTLVAMVGDGVNDAPALVRADIGIAIGSGTDVAVGAADVVLIKNNPLDIVRLIKLSKASNNKMKQNLWWATGYNALAIPLAAGVLAPIGFVLSPAIGAIVMSVSTVVVALNAQLLKRIQLDNL
jgi:Cu2+-exporting ATPase